MCRMKENHSMDMIVRTYNIHAVCVVCGVCSMRMDHSTAMLYSTMELIKAVQPSLQKGTNGSHVAIMAHCAHISDYGGPGNITFPVSKTEKVFNVQMHEANLNT